MDAVATQLILGRAQGLSANRLWSVLRDKDPRGASPTLTSVAELIGEQRTVLEALGVPPAASAWLHAPDLALIDADREWVAREQIRLLDALSADFPPLLHASGAAPPLLYVRGRAASLRNPQLAIVGTRTPTTPGRSTASEFVIGLSRAGLTITSGLALGIDAAAHEGALAAGGSTIAVLGSALDRIYPREHEPLAERIAAEGSVVSELPPRSPAIRSHFPRRNRLISGLSFGTLVVEAGEDSGALCTAQFAFRQNRKVFAVPSSIRNPLARGCHALIRSGAKLVESPGDILQEIPIFFKKQCAKEQHETHATSTAPGQSLDKGQKILLDALGFEPASIDTLVERTGFSCQSVASMLLLLELEGAVVSQAGGRYERLLQRPG